MSSRVSTRPTPPGRRQMATQTPGSVYFVDRHAIRDGVQRRGLEPDHQPHSDIGRPSAQEAPRPQPRPRAATTPDHWTPSVAKTPANYSAASMENARYHVGGSPSSDHSNEDRHFALEGDGFQVFAVFDGHDGPRAAGFASSNLMEHFKSTSWKRVVSRGPKNIPKVLEEFFTTTEADFFRSIQPFIDEKKTLQAVIPPGMKSYQAYQLYPVEVARMQELEPKMSGGCTAAVAVICKNKLYMANVGDSRVLLIREQANGTLDAQQLTVEHTTENEDELKRLEHLGLDPKELIKAGRLGSQENTRSIGDYSIKQGYRDVDILSHARAPPGTAEPYLMPPMDVDKSLRYLVVMSDGVYKSIEAVFTDSNSAESNKVLVGMLLRALKDSPSLGEASDEFLARLSKVHEDTYQTKAKKDPRSPVAVACRKRDDMTLLIYKFSVESAV